MTTSSAFRRGGSSAGSRSGRRRGAASVSVWSSCSNSLKCLLVLAVAYPVAFWWLAAKSGGGPRPGLPLSDHGAALVHLPPPPSAVQPQADAVDVNQQAVADAPRHDAASSTRLHGDQQADRELAAAPLQAPAPPAPLQAPPAPPPPPPPPPPAMPPPLADFGVSTAQQLPPRADEADDTLPPAYTGTSRKRALVFTMDSIAQYVKNSKKGGPAGEIVVRTSLQAALAHFGIDCDVAGSDDEFFKFAAHPDNYALFILDPWTFVSPGWKPRSFLIGREDCTYLLDFFGSEAAGHGLHVPATQILTPFPTTPWNTFLGYWKPAAIPNPLPDRKPEGVLWGKKREYFQGKTGLVRAAAAVAPLHSTATSAGALRQSSVTVHGHLPPDGWMQLLWSSKFVIGLGDPLLGPSALDAVAAGCVFINPRYAKPKRKVYTSQHPYLESLGAPYVCSYDEGSAAQLADCVRQALTADTRPFVPPEFTQAAYYRRVASIFARHLPTQ